MSFILALIQKVSDLFASPYLPLDADYSYAARSREAERIRRSRYAPFSLPRE
jgi:coproporphyrinogen III oxidase